MSQSTFKSEKDSPLHFNLCDSYISTIEWLSELEFSRTELSMLSKFLDKSFLRLHKKHRYNELLQLDQKVKKFLNDNLKRMQDKIKTHERHYVLLNENVLAQNDVVINEEFDESFTDFNCFKIELNKLKNELIGFIEDEWKDASTKKLTF